MESVDPVLNALSAPFWSGAAEGKLVLPHCVATGRAFWPPSPISPLVTAAAVEWREAAPKGVVNSLITYRRSFQRLLEPLMPFSVALVELQCRVRLLAHVDTKGEIALRAGDRVRLGFASLVEAGVPVPHVIGLDLP